MTEPIPSPPGWPIVGNITDLDAEFPLGSLVHLADLYGLPSKDIIFEPWLTIK